MTFEQTDDWDAVSAQQQRAGYYGLWRRHCDAVNGALLESYLPDGRFGLVLKTDLFEESLGQGLLPLLVERADSVTGVDVSEAVRTEAGSRFPQLRAVLADVRQLPFDDASFDTIISTSTLDHFESADDIRVSLGELSRVLRQGGQLLLTLDNPVNPAVFLRNALPLGWLRRIGLVPYFVGATCGRRRLVRYARQAGLDVQDTTAIMHCPRVFAVALARWFDEHGSRAGGDRFLRVLRWFEGLQRWPSRHLTGYFVVIRATKPRS